MMHFGYFESPVGSLLLAAREEALTLLSFPSGSRVNKPASDWVRDDSVFTEIARQLGEYFAGTRKVFFLPLAPLGTPFQLSVWTALQSIRFGGTCSYGALAKHIGRPRASRAVGAANGANPLPIIIPCHRVIGANGALTGFGGGLETKKYLLAHEARVVSATG